MATARLAVNQRVSWDEARIGGIAGLGFAAGVIVQNGILMGGSPSPGAEIGDVVRYYTDSGTPVMIALGLVAINAAFLLTFITVISNRLQQSEGSSLWGRIGYAAGIALFPIFATTSFLKLVLLRRVEELGAETAVYTLLWELHSAAFAMSGIALGVLLGSFSIGALAYAVVPRWTAFLGLIGAALLLTSGAFSFNVIDGGPALFAGLAGFGVWVVWLITASLRILRSPEGVS